PVLRHVPPNDVKNPGSGLADTQPGLERLMLFMIADRSFSPALVRVTKALQTATKHTVRQDHSTHPLAGVA
ncbi:MAG: hypothetical protein QOJ21_1418, partial [Solirubrobacteraceae bacterium]|nr:hypothetical protein [Solirubrobacteraceae bacterium]